MIRIRRTMQLAMFAALALPMGRAIGQSSIRGRGEWTPYLAVGPSIPTNELSAQGNVGFQVAGGAEYRINQWFGVRPELQFNLIPGRNGASNVTAFGGGASGVFNFVQTGAFRPYAIGYAGIYNLSGGGYGSTDLAFGPGIGGRFRCGARDCFVEARYISVNSPRRNAQLIPISFGWIF